MRFVHLFTFAALLGAFQVTAVSAADPIDNPLLKESTLPYHLPPFDQIKDQHFVPAMEAGMRDQLKEVDAVANNSEKPTFENTVVALERTGRSLAPSERSPISTPATPIPRCKKSTKKWRQSCRPTATPSISTANCSRASSSFTTIATHSASIPSPPISSSVITRISSGPARNFPIPTRKN